MGVKLQVLTRKRYFGENLSKFDMQKITGFNELDFWEKNIAALLGKGIFIPDVIHAHDYPTLKFGVFLKEALGGALIYDAHELYSYQSYISKLVARKIFTQEKKYVKHCNNIVVVNAEQAEIMRKDFDFHHFTPVTNAIDPPADFDPNKKYDLIRSATGIDEQSKIVLFQGLINRHRKIHLLLEGIAKTPETIHMVFLTFTKEVPEFSKLAKKLKIEHRTHFLSPVPWSEMIYWAASADVGIMPYHPHDVNTTISSPNKMYEFITAGVPMVAHKGLVNVQRILQEEGFGVTRTLETPQDYAAAIMEVFDEKLGGAQRFRDNLLKRRHAYFWEHEVKNLVGLYQGLEHEHMQQGSAISETGRPSTLSASGAALEL